MRPEDELERERAHLVKAEADIAAGQTRITEQELRIERDRAAGRSIVLSEQLLQQLNATLAQWVQHRRLILDRIDVLERRSGAAAPSEPAAE